MRTRFYTHRRQLFFVLRGDPQGSHTAIGIGLTFKLWYERTSVYGVDVRVLYLFLLKFTYISS